MVVWGLFIALIFVGLGLVVAKAPGGALLMLVGAVGNVATGVYIFVTVPRTER